jgi:peptidyl-prolyl cis-trans isomerase SurA
MPLIAIAVRMPRMSALATMAMVAMSLLASPPAARAQVVAVVSGEPVTEVDIAQRTRLIELSNQKKPTRQEVLDELIDDKLKVQLSKRYIAEVPKREIENAYASIARRAGMTVAQFTKMTAQAGITPEALKSRIHADYVWSQIVRGKFQGSLQVGEKEVEVKMEQEKKGAASETLNYDYSLRPILFLVARGASPAVFEARKKEVETFSTRFDNCEQGLRSAMMLPDVAVRETIKRQSADLAQQQRDVLAKTALGHLTPPDTTPQGIEVFAVCGKTPAAGDSVAKRTARDEIFNERYQALSKHFLKELRKQALIEYK